MVDKEHKHRHRHKHRSHRHSKDEYAILPLEDTIRTDSANTDKYKESLDNRLKKAKLVICDFIKNNSTELADLKTQFNILADGYCVNLSKVTNSLVQGTLHVVFDLLQLPQTNRGYFWDSEEYGNQSILELFNDCFSSDIITLEASLSEPKTETTKDENEIDLDEIEDEEPEMIGPSLPPPPNLTSSMEAQPKRLVGPTIPDDILTLISHGASVQVESSDDNDDVGPSLPGEETRKPTAEALQQIAAITEGDRAPKKLERCEWMTMLPDSAISNAFAATKPRRFSNLPPGCTMDPSWTETPEDRKKREEYLSKHVIGGLKEEPKLTKEKEKELDAYFEQLDSQRETLSEIYLRVKNQKSHKKQGDDVYSRDALFKRSNKKNTYEGEFIHNGGSLKSRFGSTSYQQGT